MAAKSRIHMIERNLSTKLNAKLGFIESVRVIEPSSECFENDRGY